MDRKSQASTINFDETRNFQNVSGSIVAEDRLPTTLAARSLAELHQVHDPTYRRSRLGSLVIVIITTLSMVTNMGNTTAVSIALPTIGKEFNVEPSLLQWIMSVYPLSSGCFLLVCGRLADLHGRKKAYLLGTLLLAGFTLGCGFANNIITLIVFRGIQGIGTAATIPASLGILANRFPPSRARSLAFATFAAGAPVGAAFGTVIGGLLTQKTAKTWRSSLYMFASVNVLCLIAGFVYIDKDIPHPTEDRGVDWLGALLVTVGLVMIMFVLGDGEDAPKQWATGYIIALLVVGVFILGAFIRWQWYLEKAQNQRQQNNHEGNKKILGFNLPPPMMKLSLWARGKGRFAVMMGIAFLAWSSFVGWVFWIQLYLQNYEGLTPLQAVVRAIPTFVVGLLCNLFVGIMASHTPMVIITTMGTMGTTVACVLMATINPQATYWAFIFPGMVFSVLGVDLVFTAGTLYIAKISLPHEQSLAAALFQTMTQIGTSAGITISTVVFNRVTLSLGEGEDNIRSYKAAQWTNCGFGASAVLLSFLFFWGVGPPGYSRKARDASTPELEKGDRSSIEKEG